MKSQSSFSRLSSLRCTLDRLEHDPVQTHSKEALIRLLRKRIEELQAADQHVRAGRNRGSAARDEALHRFRTNNL